MMPEISLTGVLAASAIEMELGLLSAATGAALVVGGLFSVLLFPLGALMILRTAAKPADETK